MKTSILSTFLAGLVLSACSPDDPQPEQVQINLDFSHVVDNQPLLLDQIIYKNALNQDFSIKTVKYFISDFTLHKKNGGTVEYEDIHYIDIRSPETLSLPLSRKIQIGDYTGISFIHGLKRNDNISGRFTEAPESLMEWPMMMGGGYHYMKLEGEFKAGDTENFFNFHAGGLDENEYEVHIRLDKEFNISGDDLNLTIKMEIQNWFTNPIDWDFAYFGPGIMGNHEAQQTVQKNGVDVYSFEVKQIL